MTTFCIAFYYSYLSTGVEEGSVQGSSDSKLLNGPEMEPKFQLYVQTYPQNTECYVIQYIPTSQGCQYSEFSFKF
jgi:hypothetical protein